MIKTTTLLIAILLLLLVAADNSAVLSTVPGGVVDPSKIVVKLVKNDPLSVICTVKPTLQVVDIMILEDTTGSMGPYIHVLKDAFADIYTGLASMNPAYALGQYKDKPPDPFIFNQLYTSPDFETNQATIQAAINSLSASGGGDGPEALFNAMVTFINGVAFRPSSRKVMLIFTDATSHTTADDAIYNNQADAFAALNTFSITPIIFTTDPGTPSNNFYTSLVSALGRGIVVPLSANHDTFLNAIITSIGSILNLVNTGIFQTQNYIQSVLPSSVVFTTNDPIPFTVSLLDDGTGPGTPDENAYIEFTPGWGRCYINISQVIRNKPPICDYARVNNSFLWPPNHKYVDLYILGVTDPDGDPVTITVTSILQSEPTSELHGSGNTCPDGKGIGTGIPSVRAERSGTLQGRRYLINFSASDGRGGSCTGAVDVCVPHDQGNNDSCQSVPTPTIDSTIC